MKNILAENMLRFGAKNLTESQKRTLQLLTEQSLKISKGGAVVGATKSATSNATAVDKLKGAGATVNGTITSTGCIKKAAGASATVYTVSKKSAGFEKAVNYLKIGDKVIQGSAPTSLVIKFSQLQSQEIEAAGNGIFVLGRALAANARKGEYGLNDGSALFIALGATNTNTAFFNVDSGFQSPVMQWKMAAAYSMIANKVINPTGTGSMTKYIEKGRQQPTTVLGDEAKPSISEALSPDIAAKLKTAVAIDVSTFTNNGLNTTNVDIAKKQAELYSSNYLYKFIYGIGTRFKLYIKLRAAEFGIPEGILEPILSLVDTKVSEEWANKQEYINELVTWIDYYYKRTTQGGSYRTTGAKTTAGTVSGKEGQIGTITPPKQ